MLALPIDGYGKYTTKEILLVYAYILMAYLSFVIYFISFLCIRGSDLMLRLEDESNIDALSLRNDGQVELDNNENSADNQASNQQSNLRQSDESNRRRQRLDLMMLYATNIRNEMEQMEQRSQLQNSNPRINEDSYDMRIGRYRNHANNDPQRFRDAYQIVTLEECKVEN